MGWLLEILVEEPTLLPELRRVSLRHTRDATVEEVAGIWELCQKLGLKLDWRATVAASEVVKFASASNAGCGLEGCPAIHAKQASEHLPIKHLGSSNSRSSSTCRELLSL